MKSRKKSLCRAAAFALSVILIGNSLNFSVSAQDVNGDGQTGTITAAAESSETENRQKTTEPEEGTKDETNRNPEGEAQQGSGTGDEQKQDPGTEDEQKQGPGAGDEQKPEPGTGNEQEPGMGDEQKPEPGAENEQEPGAGAEQEPGTGDEPKPDAQDEQKQENGTEGEREQEPGTKGGQEQASEPETDIEDLDGMEPPLKTNLPEEGKQVKTEPVCTVCGGAHEDGDCPVEAVRDMIEELPDVEALKEMDEEERAAAYDALQEAYDAYCGLTAEECGLLSIDEDVVFGERFAFFNAGIMLLDEGEPTALTADPEVDLSGLTGALKIRIANDVKQYSADGGQSWTDYSGSITLKGESSTHAVEVVNGEHDVIMDGIKLTHAKGSPFDIKSGAMVNLTLTGDNTVSAVDDEYASGIQVPEGAELTITKDSTGSLTASGVESGAGIGSPGGTGGSNTAGGRIVIEGGTVTANGGTSYGTGNAIKGSGAGIGGGSYGAGGTIIINGGTVKAYGGGTAAGIGGGFKGEGGDIIINGGTVNARMGIGGGNSGVGGKITINGGTVYAYRIMFGAGIGGGGTDGAGGDVIITGGNVKAVAGGLSPSDDIGAGSSYQGSDSGTLTDGNENAVSLVTITLSGVTESVSVTGIEGVESYNLKDVSTLDNMLYLYLPENVTPTAVIAGGMRYSGELNENRKGTFSVTGPVQGLQDNPVIEITTLTGNLQLQKDNGQKQYSADGGQSWTDYSGSITLKGENSTHAVEVLSGEHDVIMDGVTLTPDKGSPFAIAQGASVNMTLSGMNEVTAAEEDYAGIQVPDGAALTITEDSAGSLIATGGSYGAGIGGGNRSAGGCITINGGTVTAIGDKYGAGIGGGYQGEGGTITISGGVVVANGGSHCSYGDHTTIYGSGAGIGGGSFGAGGGKIEISGGTVTVTGGASSAGIGSGHAGKEKKTTDITISGGTVIARGDMKGAGIGGGYDCPGGIITISGGTITASGGGYGAGIGGGDSGAGGTITVSGGNVKATAGEYATKPVGAGAGASGGTLTDGKGNSVSLVTITLAEATEPIPVTAIEGAENYGLNDVYTLDTNKLYIYLPSDASPTAVTADGDRYTGTLNSNRTGTFTRGQSDVICVEITWGAMEFTYTDGVWNPETLTYDAGGWKAADGSDGITVKNTGTKDVTVSYEYEQNGISVSGVSGSFADESGAAVTDARELAAGEEKKTYLKLEGKPENVPDSGSFPLGAVTVRIGGD